MTAADDTLAQRIEDVLAVPLHRWLGVRLAHPGEPGAGIVLEVGPRSVSNAAVLHGGLLAALLDVAAYLAVLPHLQPGSNAVTHASSVAIARAVPAGATVTFRGEVVRVGRTVAFLHADASTDGTVVATAQVTKSVVRQRG